MEIIKKILLLCVCLSLSSCCSIPFLKDIACDEGGSSGKAIFATDFLKSWNNGPLFHLSPATSDAEFKGEIDWLVNSGYKTWTPYLFNDGDGSGRDVNVLSESNKKLAESRVKYAIDKGLKFCPIIWADDSSRLTSRSSQTLVNESVAAVSYFKKYISVVVPFLEPNEIKDDGKINAVGNAVKGVGVTVHVHTNPIGKSNFNANNMRFAKQGYCSGAWIQTSYPGDPMTEAQMKSAVAWAKGQIPNKKVIMFEYAFDKASLGKAAIEAGADGIGNEAPKDSLKGLSKWVD